MAFLLLQTIGGLGALSYLDVGAVIKQLKKSEEVDGAAPTRNNDSTNASSQASMDALFWGDSREARVVSRWFGRITSLAYLGSAAYSLYTLYKLVSREHSYRGSLITGRRKQRLETWKWHVNAFKDEMHFVNNDGMLLSYSEWKDVPITARANCKIVILLHAIGMHSQLYSHAARELNAMGFIVFTFDMQGHGASEGDRFFLRKWRDLVEDATGFVQAVRLRYPNSSLFLASLSSGSIVALFTAEKLQNDLKGIVLLSPILKTTPAEDLSDKIFGSLEGFMGEVMPHFPLYSNSVDYLVSGEQAGNILSNDPMLEGSIAARTALELRENSVAAFETTKTLALPLLIIHGEGDPIAPLKMTEVFLNAFTAHSDKTLIRVKTSSHDLFVDASTRSVTVERMVSWMDARAGLMVAGANSAAQWASNVTSSVTSAIKQSITQRLK